MSYVHIKKKGFTLTEVIIAMAIIMVVASAFYKVSFVAIKNSNTGKERMGALIIAQNYLEEIKGKGRIDEYRGILNKSIIENGTEYLATINIDETKPDFVQIIVNVKPKDANAVELGTKLYIRNR